MVDGFKHTVFLCHNSKEKEQVSRIRSQLWEQGIYGWLDKYDFEPFRPWADQLEEVLPQIQAAAIFIGESGVGPWANIEMREFLVEFGNRNLRIGLVLLSGCPDDLDTLSPPVPRFLKSFHWIDFRSSDPNPLEQLVWGITGQKSQGLNALPTNPFETDASANLSDPVESPGELTAEDWFDRALSKSKQGDKQGAIEDYTKAIQLKPDYSLAYNNRGNARSDSGDHQGAIEDYDQAIQMNQNWGNIGLWTAYNNRGWVYALLGDNERGIEDCNKAIQLKPDDANAYDSRGFARANLGDYQEAIKDYNQAIQLKPDNANFYLRRGLARKDSGDKQGAIADYQQSANLYQKQGKESDHQDALNQIKKLQPNFFNRIFG